MESVFLLAHVAPKMHPVLGLQQTLRPGFGKAEPLNGREEDLSLGFGRRYAKEEGEGREDFDSLGRSAVGLHLDQWAVAKIFSKDSMHATTYGT